MKKFIWTIEFYCFVKPVTLLLAWLCRKEQDNYYLFSLGEMLCDYAEKLAGDPYIKHEYLMWMLDHGIDYTIEAIRGEEDKIRQLYELDEDMDIEWCDEEIIYEYFGDRIG